MYIYIYIYTGTTVAYLNMSSIFGSEGSISEAHYNNSDVIRTATVAQKHKTLHLLLYADRNATQLMFDIKGTNMKGGQHFYVSISQSDINRIVYNMIWFIFKEGK